MKNILLFIMFIAFSFVYAEEQSPVEKEIKDASKSDVKVESDDISVEEPTVEDPVDSEKKKKKKERASSDYNSLVDAVDNPAMTSLVIDTDESLRMSFFPTFSFSGEIGEVDNFTEELEELADILDDPDSTDMSSDEVLDRFNAVLVDVGENGYLVTRFKVNAPFMPLFFSSGFLGGSVGIDYSFDLVGGISVLDDELFYNDQNGTFSTSTSIYLKSGVEKTISGSYSRHVYKNTKGNLYAGAKLKFITLELSKQLIPLEEMAGDDIDDLIKDEYDNNQVSTSGVGLDIGLIWDSESYRIGLTLLNANAPKFKYGEIGVDCEDIAENTSARSSCEAARYFSQQLGRIKANEVHTKHAYLRASGLVKLSDSWQLTSILDLAKYDDVIGDENQWFHAGLTYDSTTAFLPSLRLGYKTNLAGTKTSSVNFGFILFKIISMDFEYGLDKIVVDDSSTPRRFGFGISVQESF